jgi:SAM-dependent methyltransferase
MTHQDHVRLLRKGVAGQGGVWADLGSGAGAFTLALAELIGPQGHIYSVDRDRRALTQQKQTMHALFPSVDVRYLDADFTAALDLPLLDGIMCAKRMHSCSRCAAICAPVGACCSSSTMRIAATPGCHIRSRMGRGRTWRGATASPAHNC